MIAPPSAMNASPTGANAPSSQPSASPILLIIPPRSFHQPSDAPTRYNAANAAITARIGTISPDIGASKAPNDAVITPITPVSPPPATAVPIIPVISGPKKPPTALIAPPTIVIIGPSVVNIGARNASAPSAVPIAPPKRSSTAMNCLTGSGKSLNHLARFPTKSARIFTTGNNASPTCFLKVPQLLFIFCIAASVVLL